MHRWLLLLGCLAILNVGKANPFGEQFAARYDDFKVYRLRYLTELKGVGYKHDIVIDPAHQTQLENQMKFLELDSECIIEDLQSVIEMSQTNTFGRSKPEMNWEQYQHLDTIYDWLDGITEANSKIVTSYTIGYSYEGRPIKANKEIRNLLKKYDWIFVPVLNPDGFEYSHKVNRLWRKNRKPTGFSNSSVAGYNLDVPCDHWYGGAESDSEPEVISLEEFVKSFDSDYIRIYLAVHCFGNWVLLPYSHTSTEFPPNYDQMMRISEKFAAARVTITVPEFLTWR
ncbi:hypothetical protein DOY81_012397 [Sarcophaga bullata]|nr:hypothetical protein DOY81_012397 [Sarcophaga bullata]